MKLCMIGTGYVGLVSGVCFSDLGNEVICVDKDKDKINSLKRGKIPIYEPGLTELVNKNYKNNRLKFSTDLKKSVKESDIIFICVGTPTKTKDGSADLTQVYNTANEISRSLNKFKIAVLTKLVIMPTSLVKFVINLPECLLSTYCVSAFIKAENISTWISRLTFSETFIDFNCFSSNAILTYEILSIFKIESKNVWLNDKCVLLPFTGSVTNIFMAPYIVTNIIYFIRIAVSQFYLEPHNQAKPFQQKN